MALDRGAASLFRCQHGGKTLNMALVTTLGRPRYWHGATAPEALSPEVPPTGQLLHFEIMKHLASRGRPVYDLGGSPGPEPIQGHPNYGVWYFKHKFSGKYVFYFDRWDFECSKAIWRVVSWINNFR